MTNKTTSKTSNKTSNLSSIIAELGINLTPQMSEQFMLYNDILLEWNSKINLTAITDEQEIYIKHFADSLSLALALELEGKSIVDIGTGAGFPGIPLKICFPNTKVLLVDSLNKRISFLEAVIKNLQLNDIEAVHARAEDINMRESFDICTSRAVSQLNVLLEYCMPLVRVGGFVAAMKSDNIEEELNASKNAIELLGGELFDIKTISLPQSNIIHKIVVIKKVRQTDTIYPRSSKKITKAPLI